MDKDHYGLLVSLSKSKDENQYEERRQHLIDVVGGAGMSLLVAFLFETPISGCPHS